MKLKPVDGDDTKIEPRALSDVALPQSSRWAGAWKLTATGAALALVASAYGATLDATRFAYAYLFAFVTCLTFALGALFFVLVQHLTGAAWSVTVRRTSEFLMSGLPVFVLLVIPVLAMTGRLYPWDGAARVAEPAQVGAFANALDEGSKEPRALAAANRDLGPALEKARERETEEILRRRSAYMNRPFFMVRALAFLGVWGFLAWRFFRWSTRQDVQRTARSTKLAERLAPAATVAFAITLVLAAVDWVMSLETLWSSTIFGVYLFAGCVVAHAALLILVLLALQEAGYLKSVVSNEHYHDLGKLLFGWLSFWAYIAFVQFFLIWYANLPEEVSFFHQRWDDNEGTWRPLSWALFLLHFIVPFWLLLSRNMKRNAIALGGGAILVVALHVVDVYWLILPNAGPLAVHWLDFTCLTFVASVYATAVLVGMRAHALVPIGDPRLSRALAFENS
jgi:hypothetical protein